MRIKCNPEEAKYATLNGEEFVADGRNWMPNRIRLGWLNTSTMQTLGATFERDLPPVPDGKEYEYKEGDAQWTVRPGCYVWEEIEGGWLASVGMTYQSAPGCIYAIPIKKESCVVEGKVDYIAGRGCVILTDMGYGAEVLIIPKGQVIEDRACGGNRLIVVREDK